MFNDTRLLHRIGALGVVAIALLALPFAACAGKGGANPPAPGGTAAEAGQWDWPQYRGPDRNGISKETGWVAEWPKSGPNTLWKVNVGTGFATVSVANGRLFTMGNENDQDTVYCLNPETGEQIWTHTYECKVFSKQHEGGPSATPAVDGDRVYTLSKFGDLHCYDVKDGSLIWSKNLEKDFGAKVPTWGYSNSSLVDGDKLIVDAGHTYALDKKTGEVIWKSAEDLGPGYSSPVVFELDGKRIYAMYNAYGLVLIAAADGKEIDRFEWDTNYDVNAATPIINGDEIFIASGYNKGCALLKINDGQLEEIWSSREMRNHFNSSVLWKDHLYGFDESNVKCLSYKDGEQKWEQRGLGKGSLMLADGKLIILSERGELVIAEASPEEFKEISRTHVLGGKCWTVPVLSNGRIYCRNAAGDLVCVDVSGKDVAEAADKSNREES